MPFVFGPWQALSRWLAAAPVRPPRAPRHRRPL